MKEKICAIIELSPMGLKCKIAQRHENSFSILDSIDYHMEILSNPSFDEIEKLCNVLEKLKNNLKTYEVSKQNIIFYTMNSLEENKNKAFMLDIIKTKTGFDLIFFDLKQKNIYVFKKILSQIGSLPLLEETTLIAGIDYGHITIIVLEKGNVVYTEDFSLGTIKINEIIKSINYNPTKTDIVIEEYFLNYLNILKKQLVPRNIKNLIIRGSLFELVNKQILINQKDSLPYATKADFLENLENLKHFPEEKLAEKFSILETRAELIIPKLVFSKLLIHLTNVDKVYSLDASLMESVISQQLFAREASKYNKNIYDSIIASSKKIGEKYLYDESHAENVKFLTMNLFSVMKKEQNFSNKDKILLEAACYLHDIGKFLSLKEHYKHSYLLIKGTTIFGLNEEDIEIIALLSYFHSKKTPSFSSRFLKRFDDPTKMKITKLIAILRIADSLDRSHKQKITNISFKIENHTLNVFVKCKTKLLIENWSFQQKAELFQNTFGLKPILILV